MLAKHYNGTSYQHSSTLTRKHQDITCTCAECYRFDHQSTQVLQRPASAHTSTGRKHLEVMCNCPDCQRFDYSNTAMLYRSEPELEKTILRRWTFDTETGERILYHLETITAIDTETGQQFEYLLA